MQFQFIIFKRYSLWIDEPDLFIDASYGLEPESRRVTSFIVDYAVFKSFAKGSANQSSTDSIRWGIRWAIRALNSPFDALWVLFVIFKDVRVRFICQKRNPNFIRSKNSIILLEAEDPF